MPACWGAVPLREDAMLHPAGPGEALVAWLRVQIDWSGGASPSDAARRLDPGRNTLTRKLGASRKRSR